MSLFKMSLLASASLVLCVAGATAQSADNTASNDQTEQRREMDAIVVVGQAQTYSSAESTEAMALQQAPVSSILAQIDNLPGVLVTEGDTFGFDDWSTGVAVRGFQNNLSEQQLGITIDGLPNGNSNYGGGAKANRYIDTQNAGGIEVSQGTADIASRSNEALGGTLNFTTQDPEDERRVRVSTSLGDYDSQRFYGRYDSGLLADGTTKFWVSLSTQSATDHIEGSAENERDHFAAKLLTQKLGWDWTAYMSFDDTQEDNYQRVWSQDQYETNPHTDYLTGEWTGIPAIDQNYRRGWSTLRENFFTYVRAEKEFDNGLGLKFNLYRHDNDGRGDWIPPYIVDVNADTSAESEVTGGVTNYGGSFLGQIFYVDANGNAVSADADGAIAVQSYRHTHYQKERTGLTADFDWKKSFANFDNTVRGGLWYEDATRYEYRDWHRILDTRVGFDYDYQAYWVQYNREFPQTTFKWYLEDVININDFTVRLGLKQFNNKIERKDLFNPTDPAENFSLDSESDVLLSGGVSWAPSAMPGVEVFAGYAENYKAIPDGVLEVISGSGIPDPETAENIEVGVRYAGDRLRGSAVYFDSTFENRLFPAPTEGVDGIDYLEASNGGYINGGGIDSSGFELTGEYLVNENLSLFTSYTYNDSTILGTGDTALDTAAGIYAGNVVPGIPKNMFVISADYQQDNFFGGLSTKWVDDRFVDLGNTWTADSYAQADLYVGVHGEQLSEDLANVDFRLTVNNLFDESYLAGISGGGAWISAPRTVVFTATADF
ncbi:TonB-dependent receptor domain-containing protein [Hyphomonas sp.]|uniref:TonB-dependent receptor domain-containing protein n=1 Tax=Hyphomonas sp. TaxID=87 RepID=UPI003527E0FE